MLPEYMDLFWLYVLLSKLKDNYLKSSLIICRPVDIQNIMIMGKQGKLKHLYVVFMNVTQKMYCS